MVISLLIASRGYWLGRCLAYDGKPGSAGGCQLANEHLFESDSSKGVHWLFAMECNARRNILQCNARCDIVQCNARCNVTKHNNTWGTGCLQCNAMQCDEAWDTFQKYDYNADALFAMCTGSRWFQQELDFLAAVDTYILKSPFTLQLFFELCPDS